MLSHGGSVNSCAASGNSSRAEKKSGWCNTNYRHRINRRMKILLALRRCNTGSGDPFSGPFAEYEREEFQR
jgi:hypothetical protein